MPRSILRVWIWNFNLIFEPHVQKNVRLAFFFLFFFRKGMAAFVFFPDRCIDHISRTKEENEKGRSLVCSLVHCQHRAKHHIPTCKIERGIANLTRNQHLGWCSSYAMVFSSGSSFRLLSKSFVWERGLKLPNGAAVLKKKRVHLYRSSRHVVLFFNDT